ncbi:N-glycosylase/DNA lyase [Candidatus Woesearchaeota archaeon]|nr:N-glycosylase/DNA lyase [Candidatus Woesearchaeota archaeon]
MKKLVSEINKLRKTNVRKTINIRLKEFESFKAKGTSQWFSELCFCILTANSKAHTALKIQDELGPEGFCSCTAGEVRKCIMKHKHRFHNNKARFIAEARKNIGIKKKMEKLNDFEAREWLVKNIKGIGYKEASHFLRNTGRKNLAILDRHILNLMAENKIITKPKTLTRKNYLEIETRFSKIAEELNMAPAELDMYMWFMKTGEVLK